MKIFDLHTHILPGIDDGAQSMKEALEMVSNAAAGETCVLVATPHANVPQGYGNKSAVREAYRSLLKAVEKENIPMQIFLGAEVRATEDLPLLLEQGEILSLNGSRYLLTEFSPMNSPLFCRERISEILACGYVPLIAHPERYRAVWEHPRLATEWVEMGCHLQLTAGSILGKFGTEAKKTADFLLSRDYVACVASDAHGATMRTNFLGETYRYLELYYSKEYAKALFWDNPQCLCRNETL